MLQYLLKMLTIPLYAIFVALTVICILWEIAVCAIGAGGILLGRGCNQLCENVLRLLES